MDLTLLSLKDQTMKSCSKDTMTYSTTQRALYNLLQMQLMLHQDALSLLSSKETLVDLMDSCLKLLWTFSEQWAPKKSILLVQMKDGCSWEYGVLRLILKREEVKSVQA
jgi:hypothetical protein